MNDDLLIEELAKQFIILAEEVEEEDTTQLDWAWKEESSPSGKEAYVIEDTSEDPEDDVQAPESDYSVVLDGEAITVAGVAVTTLKREYRVLYEYLLEVGYTEAEAIVALLQKSLSQDVELSLDNTDGGYKPCTGLRIQYPVSELRAAIPNWDNLSDKQKDKTLSQLGFDTQHYNVYSTMGLYRDKNNDLHYGEILYSQERTDWLWTGKRVNGKKVASVDAIVRNSIGKWDMILEMI